MTTKFFNGVEVLGSAIMPTPTADGHAATKYYTDSSVGSAVAALGAIDASIRSAMFGEGATSYAYSAPQSLAGTVSIKNALDVLAGRVVNSTADALADANQYTDQKISDLVNAAPQMLDTLKEIADFLGADNNTDMAETILERIGAVDSALASEVTRATTAESGLDSRLDTLEGASTVVGSVDQKVKVETDRALLAEAGLLSAIQSEATARENADDLLRDDLDAEILNRIAGDNAEATARANADTALQGEIDAEETRALAAEGVIAGNLAAEITRATAAEGVLTANLTAEAGFRLAADNLLDGRLDKVETNLGTEIAYVYENNAGVYADAVAGVQDASLRDGWYFKNTSAGQKVNWYFFDGQAENVTLGDFSAYYVATFDSITSLPMLAIYTTPTGTGDAAAWYKSRKAMVPTGTPVVGKKYLVYFGTEPEVHPELPRLQMVPSQTSTTGTLAPTERVLFANLGSNSGASVNTVQFVAESVGVFSPSIKRKIQFRIRPSSSLALSQEITNRTNADSTLQTNINNEASARASADTTLQTNINNEATARISGDASTLASAKSYTDTSIANLVDAAPALLDTLNELAAAIGDDPNFATTIANQVGTVQSNLAAEITRATGVESGLDSRLDTLEGDSTVSGSVDQKVKVETDRALEAEGVLAQDLADEVLARINDVNDEETRAMAAELTLTNNLSAEITNRIADVNAEETRAMAAELLISNNLSAEITNRIADVDAEETRAKAAELALTNRINDLVAGAGMTRSGDTFNVVGTAGRLSVAADSIDVDTTLIPNLVMGDAGKRVRVNGSGNGFEYKAAADVLVTDSAQGELAAAEYVRLKAIMPVVFSGSIGDNQAATAVDATMSFPAADADAAMFDVLLKRNGKVMIGRIRITVGDSGSDIDISTEGLDPGPVGVTFTAVLVGSDVVLKAATTSTGFPVAVKMHRTLMKI